MSKAKKAKLAKSKKPTSKPRARGFPDQNRGIRGVKSKSKPHVPSTSKPKAQPASTSKPASKPSSTPQSSQTGFSVPFTPSHHILLVGEGDFSFSASLFTTHSCTHLTATTFETQNGLLQKHPQARAHLNTISTSPNAHIHYSIDATALLHPTRGGGSNLRKHGPWQRVVFQFPHTGGLTKDVNRQVRANQELCVRFLESASKPDVLAKGGRIVVTLFEGEPYELWGIRQLARHAGLAVVRSARFEWERYPGYRHARTLGNLRGETGWKGEDREARMYIFARKGEEVEGVDDGGLGGGIKKKRKRGEDASDDESEAEVQADDAKEDEVGEEDEDDDDVKDEGTGKEVSP